MQLHDLGKKIAVIGSGLSGLSVAYLLAKKHHVYVFEKDNDCGGYIKTVSIKTGIDQGKYLDMGFNVFYAKTSTTLLKILEKLELPVSMVPRSHCIISNSLNRPYYLNKLLRIHALKSNMLMPQFYKFTYELNVLNRYIQTFNKKNKMINDSLQTWVENNKLSNHMVKIIIEPLANICFCVNKKQLYQLPISIIIELLKLFALLPSSQVGSWFRISNGGHLFKEKIINKIQSIDYNTPIKKIKRFENGVALYTSANQEHFFDKVVIATQANQALQLLENPTEKETALLGAWTYADKQLILHTDDVCMPKKRFSRTKQHYNQIIRVEKEMVSTSYMINNVQPSTLENIYFSTLNSHYQIDESYIINKMNISFPIYNQASIQTQSRLASLQNNQHTFYCGSYFNNEYVEDSINSVADVAKYFDILV